MVDFLVTADALRSDDGLTEFLYSFFEFPYLIFQLVFCSRLLDVLLLAWPVARRPWQPNRDADRSALFLVWEQRLKWRLRPSPKSVLELPTKRKSWRKTHTSRTPKNGQNCGTGSRSPSSFADQSSSSPLPRIFFSKSTTTERRVLCQSTWASATRSSHGSVETAIFSTKPAGPSAKLRCPKQLLGSIKGHFQYRSLF